jgi:hypothetical protein
MRQYKIRSPSPYHHTDGSRISCDPRGDNGGIDHTEIDDTADLQLVIDDCIIAASHTARTDVVLSGPGGATDVGRQFFVCHHIGAGEDFLDAPGRECAGMTNFAAQFEPFSTQINISLSLEVSWVD